MSIANNKKAFHDFFIEDQIEAGIVLEGWEVKAIRAARVQLKESYIYWKKDAFYLVGCHITALPTASTHVKPDPVRPRKLLLKQSEINKLIGKTERAGYTIVPLNLHYTRGRIKVEIGLAKGKKQHDKRQSLKEADWKREKQRLMKNFFFFFPGAFLKRGGLNIYCLNILKGKQMKTMILAAASAVLLLGACSTTEQRVLKPEELTSIKHVCIIQNAKVRPHDLDRALSKALAKRGIGSTIVTADNRGKLYDSSCPYNLRYKTKGNNEILRKGVFVLRSTKYAVSTVSYSLNDENHFRTNPDLVKQAEGVVAKLLEKNSK